MLNILISSVNKIAFSIGDLDIAWYGIIVTTAILAAFFLFMFLAHKSGIDDDFILETFIWVIILAVIFCRLFYVVGHDSYWPIEDWDDFVRLFNIREGGLTIIGGVVGGALGVFLCCLRNKKYSFAKVADCVVIALLLGQIIGRWGNFFNQELYGIEITNPKLQWFPIAVFIDARNGYYAASFFYEGVLNAIGLAIALTLFFKYKDRLKPFTLSLFYLGWYGIVRGSLEFIKFEKANIGNTNIGVVQVMCLCMFVISIVLQVLLQMGKISFETRWFRNLCEAKAKKIDEEKTNTVIGTQEEVDKILNQSTQKQENIANKDEKK